MEWDEYKKICDHPSVLTRWLLEQTLRICDPKCAILLESILKATPISKPTEHKGSAAIDMFKTSLNRNVVAQIANQVQSAVQADTKTTGLIERDYSNIEKAWLEYLHWCDEIDHSQSSTINESSTK